MGCVYENLEPNDLDVMILPRKHAMITPYGNDSVAHLHGRNVFGRLATIYAKHGRRWSANVVAASAGRDGHMNASFGDDLKNRKFANQEINAAQINS